MYAYSVFLADVDTYGIYFHDLWEKMHEIRSKAEYKGKYAYRGADQELFICSAWDRSDRGKNDNVGIAGAWAGYKWKYWQSEWCIWRSDRAVADTIM